MASIELESWWIFKAGGLVTDSDSATWRITTPTPADTINWDSGANTVDGAPVAARPRLTEPKFNFAGTPPAPAARTLTGMAYRDAGPLGTVAVTTGTGSSASVPGLIWGTNWQCTWNISINVTPGPGPNVSYDITAEADDPIRLKRDTFADNTEGKTSLYLPVGLRNLAHGDGGGGLAVSYETADGRVGLIDIRSSGSGVSARGDEPDALQIYLISDPNENPMASGVRPYTLSELRDVLAARMSGGVQTYPLMLGLLLENIPVPTQEFDGDDVVATFHVTGHLSEVGRGEDGDRGRRRQERDG